MLLLVITLPGNFLFSQKQISKEGLAFLPPEIHPGIRKSFTLFIPDSVIKNYNRIIPYSDSDDKAARLFYDSLKAKASKYIVTKKLYDFLIVSLKQTPDKHLSQSSDQAFVRYSGKKIRNIDIHRLDVFGTDLNNPLLYSPNKLESLLNKTHLNTNEFIIRKNLIFSEGDTLSPLLLSDNERLLRQLPFIEDSRIVVIPVDAEFVDVVVITKDVYSIGGSFDYATLKKGSVTVFDKNILGMGHEFQFMVPYDSKLPDSPGFGFNYTSNNISKTFINLGLFYFDGLGKRSYGFSIDRKFVSSATKYAGGISIREMFTTEDLDTLTVPAPLKYNLQDYWLARSLLLNKEPVTRLIGGLRYTNNNVFDHPFILPDSYQYLQQYKIFLGSLALSVQKYYKTNLIYGYGKTEDVPSGSLFSITAGKEISEFKQRIYTGIGASAARSIKNLGYFYAYAGISTYFHNRNTEQGHLILKANYFSDLLYLGNYRVRNFIKVNYTRGFDRYTDEYLTFNPENGFTGFKSDSARSTQRLSIGFESVLFYPGNILGFKLAFFTFGDLGFLFRTNQVVGDGDVLSSIGIGIRFRNDHLVFNTFQIRLGFFPNLPMYSKVNYFTFSGEQMLRPENFDPGAPSVIPYR